MTQENFDMLKEEIKEYKALEAKKEKAFKIQSARYKEDIEFKQRERIDTMKMYSEKDKVTLNKIPI